MIYDGNGKKPFKGDIAINADTIAFIGDLSAAHSRQVIDAKGYGGSTRFHKHAELGQRIADTGWTLAK
jgi:N-acyl-D-amino-acid deacylase